MRRSPGVFLILLSACDALWMPFSQISPDACQRGGNQCVAGEVCDPVTRRCYSQGFDGGLVDLSPKIDAISPSLGPAAGGIMISINGQNFAEGATVRIAGLLATQVSVLSDKQMTAMLPTQPGAFGKVSVLVQNPDGHLWSRNDLFGYYASQLAFPNPVFDVGMQPTSVAIGDFNGDNQPDLAVANALSFNVSVLLNDGIGGFASVSNFPVGVNATSVAVADFNEDQKLDLAVVNAGSNSVTVLLGDGAGNFVSPSSQSVGTSPGSVVVADFDGDQRLDIVASSNDKNFAAVLWNLSR